MDGTQYNHKLLQQIREEHFTQEALAKQLKVHPKTISRAETGVVASFDLLQKMTRACGRSVKEVIYDVQIA